MDLGLIKSGSELLQQVGICDPQTEVYYTFLFFIFFVKIRSLIPWPSFEILKKQIVASTPL